MAAIAVPEWTTALPDWERRIVAGESLIPCPPLFPVEAERGLEVFKSLRVYDVLGRPTFGQIARPWVFEFVGAVFGAYDPEAERQMIAEFLLLIAKKNSKSTIAAGLMMTALILNPRFSAELIILAPTKEIADNSFDPAADMADSINEAQEAVGEAALFRTYRRERRIVHLGTGAELKVIAADDKTVGGKKASIVLVDELWQFGKMPGSMSMFREAIGGLTARPEGFVIYLTTMSDGPPLGEFKAKLDYARAVRDGKIVDRRFMPVLYEFPAELLAAKAYLDSANFYVTNPNIGASVDLDFLIREKEKAEIAGDAALRDFLAKHLNVPIVHAASSSDWAGAAVWDQRGDPDLTLDSILMQSDAVTVGIDGGGADDLLGLAVLGRHATTRRWMLWSHAWVHPIGLERRKSLITEYERLKEAGDLTIIEDYPEDLEGVVAIVEKILDMGLLAGVGADQIGIAGIVEALAEIGVTQEAELLAGVSQGYPLTGAIKGIERKLIDGTFVHCAQPLMSWAIGNARVEPTKNAFLITKQASGTGKIDPVMALFDAAKLMERNPEAGHAYADGRSLRHV